MRKLFTGILLFCVLSSCSAAGGSSPDARDVPTALSTDTPIPFTATPETLAITGLPRQQALGMQYSTVAEALADLKRRDGVSVQVMQGWTIVIEADGLTNWSFPPSDHPAYPAVAKRILYRDQDGWHLRMDILCEAAPAACDDFLKYFEAMNAPMYQYIALHQ
jgi:hypothetical protein